MKRETLIARIDLSYCLINYSKKKWDLWFQNCLVLVGKSPMSLNYLDLLTCKDTKPKKIINGEW
jgi:hypothetical protein